MRKRNVLKDHTIRDVSEKDFLWSEEENIKRLNDSCSLGGYTSHLDIEIRMGSNDSLKIFKQRSGIMQK